MDNQLQLVHAALEPHARILVLCPTFYAARGWSRHLAKEMGTYQYNYSRDDFTLYGLDEQLIQFWHVESVRDTKEKLAGIPGVTNVFYSRDLGVSLDDLLWWARSRMRLLPDSLFKGIMSIEPLIMK